MQASGAAKRLHWCVTPAAALCPADGSRRPVASDTTLRNSVQSLMLQAAVSLDGAMLVAGLMLGTTNTTTVTVAA